MTATDPIGVPDPTVFHYPRPGIGNVGSYQVAGVPFLTGGNVISATEIKVEFPRITKRLFIRSKASADLRIHFASSGSAGGANVLSNNHFITLPSSGSFDMSVKCVTVFVSAPPGNSGPFELFAELTSIPRGEMFALTGAGLTD